MTAVALAEPQTQQLALSTDVRRMEKQFALALPEHVSPERFVRVVVTAIQANPDLQKADRDSVLGAALKCAQDGLVPDGREAALVVYGNKAQYLPMIAGVLAKVRRSGELRTIAAHVVYEKDTFAYTLGDEEKIEHQPFLEGPRGNAIAVYAVAHTKDGGVYREVMSLEEITQVRNVSRAKGNGPWVTWWGEMARKTVLRRLSKRLPMSTDLQQVFQRDDDHYDLRQAQGAAKMRRLHADFDEPADPAKDAPDASAGPDLDEALDGDFVPGHDTETSSEAAMEPEEPNKPSGGGDDLFPGDRPATAYETADQFDPLTWAAEQNRLLEAAATVADLDALTKAPDAGANFAALKDHSPGIAKTLDAALTGKRKALADRERSA